MLLNPETIDQQVKKLEDAVEENDTAAAIQTAGGLSSPRIAAVIRNADIGFILDVLNGLPHEKTGRVLGYLPYEQISDIFKAGDNFINTLLASLPPDEAVDILQHMPEKDRDALLDRVSDERRRELQLLSSYDPETAGGVMTPRFVAIENKCNVRETIDALFAGPVEAERPAYVYVQNAFGVLQGVVSLKDLLRSNPSHNIADVMNTKVVTARTGDPAEEAAALLRDRRFATLPVVDDADRLVGVIAFEDAMNILSRDIAENFVSVGGPTDESFFTTPGAAIKKRLPWMAANVFLNLGAVTVITGFEATIEQVAILAAFLPMITDMGGNVGIQSLSVAIRSLALGESKMRDFARACRKELLIGLFNGVALGLLFALIAFAWRGNIWLGALAGIALGVNVLLAGVVGGCLPFLIKALGKDPAMMTGPFLTTITDISGVTVYLGLSTLFLMRLL